MSDCLKSPGKTDGGSVLQLCFATPQNFSNFQVPTSTTHFPLILSEQNAMCFLIVSPFVWNASCWKWRLSTLRLSCEMVLRMSGPLWLLWGRNCSPNRLQLITLSNLSSLINEERLRRAPKRLKDRRQVVYFFLLFRALPFAAFPYLLFF